MSTSVNFNNSSFTVPSTGEENWSGPTGVDGLLVSLGNNALSKAGGTFTIGAEIDFGGTAGLKAKSYISRGTNVSTTGIVRLANAETVAWRNAGNSADLALSVDSSNNLTFNGGIVFPASIGSANTVAVSDGTNLTWATIVNANVSASAAIAHSKIAALTASRALASDGSGIVTVSTVTTTELQRLSGITSTAVGISDTQTLTNKTITSFTGGSSSTITTPSATGTLATLAGTEVLTNKDHDGGTASNSSRITFPKASLSTLSGLTRKEGTVWYASDTDKLYKDDGTSLTEIGSGSGGSINYIGNPDAESGTTGWAAYADAAGTSPVDGTGGAPTVTITRTTTTPLRGTGSFLITKDAANRQGEGVSYAFSVDSADKAKVLNISFDYEIASGTFVSGDSSDLRIWIYDVTNSVLIPVSPYTIQGGGSNQWTFKGVFQTASNSTSYRLIIHVATTSASAWGFEFDNVVVGPQIQLMGAAISNFGDVSWTPTGSWSTNTTYTGAFRMVGDTMEGWVKVALSGAPTAANLTVNLPSGYTIDTGKISNSSANVTLGNITIFDSGTATYNGFLGYSSTTAMAAYVILVSGTYSQTNNQEISNTLPMTFANSDLIHLEFKVPILGKSSAVLMSSDTDTRVVAMRASGNAASASSGNPIIFPTTDYDTHNGFASGRYTAPVGGYYQISGYIDSANNAIVLTAYIDGSSSINVGRTDSSSGCCSFAGTVKVNAGQIIDIRPSSGTLDATAPSLLSIQRISGPSAIAASETIACKYVNVTNGTSISSTTIIPFITKSYDTHGAYNSSTGVFTCPAGGKYRVSMNAVVTATFALGNSNTVGVYKNTTLDIQNFQRTAGSVGTDTISINGELSCLAGDTIDIRLTSGGTLPTTTADANYNFLCITRIGN
jgi:hypothetical protein